MAVNLGQQVRLRKIKAHKLPIESGPEAPPAGEQIDSLQQVGLALGIGAGDHIGSGIKAHRLPLVIAEAVERDFIDSHAQACVTSSV